MKNTKPTKLGLIYKNELRVYNDRTLVSGPYIIDWKQVTEQEIFDAVKQDYSKPDTPKKA